MTENKELQTTDKNIPVGERFLSLIIAQASDGINDFNLNARTKTLIKTYFMAIDTSLKKAEVERVNKNANNSDHKYDNEIPYNWKTLNITVETARQLASSAKLGFDMSLPNMLSPVFFKNNKEQKYELSLIPGYKGRELVAMKYALNVPKAVRIQLVYSTDKFIPHLDGTSGDSYEFEMTMPFDRGDFVGAFAYEIYEDTTMNKLSILSKADIEKRKPAHASANFWGGTGTAYEKGQRVSKEIPGWFDEMAYKTMANYVFKRMTIDPSKVDDSYRSVSAIDNTEAQLKEVIDENANVEDIDIHAEPKRMIAPKIIKDEVVKGEVVKDEVIEKIAVQDLEF